uniref:Purple acid phosphatase n=1 Tax=Globisporangium ultimum (strain ATCC 200006 / CBS 805.95 / DAOM BR144) TaxID=431595 RepID=K3WGB9_GLOUD
MRTRVAALLSLLCVGALTLLVASANGGTTPVYVHDFFAMHALPSQIHIALADAHRNGGLNPTNEMQRVGMTISWATAMKTKTSVVKFGQNPANLTREVRAEIPCEQYEFCEYTSPWFHHVTIDGDLLVSGTTFYYQCGDEDAGWSDVHSFTTALPIGSQAPMTFGVIGDLGQTKFSEQTLRHLSDRSGLTAILHAGDLSYADSEQPRWDRWGRLVEPLSSRMPWMVAAGNHEEEHPCQADVDRFVAYQVRFRMPFERHSHLQRRNLFYGFRVGMVHVIVLTPYAASGKESAQYEWLEEELMHHVDRKITPWVCVIMHGPWYNSNKAHQGAEPHVPMKHNMEDLLYEHKVDLVISGHVHAYERSFPVYKGDVINDGIVYWVVGDGGNREGLAPTYLDPQPSWSAFRQANYGFGLFHILNQTHAKIEWYEDQETGDPVLHDTAWLSTTQFRVSQRHF